MAIELQQNAALFNKVQQKTAGNSETGADVWNRITAKTVNTSEYAFVRDYELPDEVIKRINVSGKGSGCLGVVVAITLATVGVAVAGLSG